MTSTERATGELFGNLWPVYNGPEFEASVALVLERIRLGCPELIERLHGEACLDAGCGGGRASVALARLGADVTGLDLGLAGLVEAAGRTAGSARFVQGTLRRLPFASSTFEFVWCSGVLQHAEDPDVVVREIARVLRPGGSAYFLVYATGGLRWPLMQLLRPIAGLIGRSAMEEAIASAGLPAPKRRTVLDDLFVPRIDFYEWSRVVEMFARAGLPDLQRWGPETRLDHESDLGAYAADLRAFLAAFRAGSGHKDPEWAGLFSGGASLVSAVVSVIQAFEDDVRSGRMDRDAAMRACIGQGHHRFIARAETP